MSTSKQQLEAQKKGDSVKTFKLNRYNTRGFILFNVNFLRDLRSP